MLRAARKVTILAFTLLPSCALSSDEIRFVGSIEKTEISKIREKLEMGKYKSTRISSSGGPALDVLEVLDLIHKYKLDIKIDNYCMSSCAEMIFLTKSKIEMVNDPLLGFHGNAFTGYMLEKSSHNDEDAACYFRNITSKFFPYVSVDKAKYDKFNLDMLDRKKVVSVFKNYDQNGNSRFYAGCPEYTFASKNKFWFPDSSYLKNEMGLNFKGRIAADDIAIAREKIEQNWPYGATNIVGSLEVSTKK